VIAGLGPYPERRDSGVVRLGEVPSHWRVKRLRTVAELRVSNVDKKEHDGEQQVRLCNYVDVFKNDSIRADMPFMAASASLREIERFRLRVGDVLITKDSEDWREIGVPAYVAEQAEDLVCGYHLAILRPWSDDLVGRYLHWQLQGDHAHWQLSVSAKGVTRYGLDQDGMKSLILAVPPPNEQAAIVRFLDYADWRVRRSIAAKQKMIRLLEEQKAAIIHQAVTRGLNPDAPMKPSGVAWLGDIPAHWKVTRVKDEFQNLNTRRVPLSASARSEMTERSFDYYGASGVIDQVDDFLFDEDLLLIAEDGANLVGRNLPLAIIARGKYWVNNHAHILRPKRGSLDYLACYMEGLHYQPWITGAAQPKLTMDRLMSIKIAVAPPEEQHALMSATSERTTELRSAISLARREVGLLKEYRERLVADVVTGKLDVRVASADLPDQPPEERWAQEAAVGEEFEDAEFDAEEELEEA
jgi:type I restriction enzyme S subunit